MGWGDEWLARGFESHVVKNAFNPMSPCMLLKNQPAAFPGDSITFHRIIQIAFHDVASVGDLEVVVVFAWLEYRLQFTGLVILWCFEDQHEPAGGQAIKDPEMEIQCPIVKVDP